MIIEYLPCGNLVWGVWGFNMVCGGPQTHTSAALHVHTLLSLKQLAVGDRYELVLQSKQQRNCPAILIPDGAFRAMYCPQHGIRVYDARTGHMWLTLSKAVIRGVQTRSAEQLVHEIIWSSCGAFLLVSTAASLYGPAVELLAFKLCACLLVTGPLLGSH